MSVALELERETELIALAKNGTSVEREAAFKEIFEVFHKRVYGFCFNLTRNRADAEDASQEVFVAVFRALPRFVPEARLSTWIYKMTIRIALRIKSRHSEDTEPLSEDLPAPQGSDPAIAEERARKLIQALGKLSAEHRVVLSLFGVDGLSHKEIASVLGIPEGTVWSRLHVARKKLAEEIRRFR